MNDTTHRIGIKDAKLSSQAEMTLANFKIGPRERTHRLCELAIDPMTLPGDALELIRLASRAITRTSEFDERDQMISEIIEAYLDIEQIQFRSHTGRPINILIEALEVAGGVSNPMKRISLLASVALRQLEEDFDATRAVSMIRQAKGLLRDSGDIDEAERVLMRISSARANRARHRAA